MKVDFEYIKDGWKDKVGYYFQLGLVLIGAMNLSDNSENLNTLRRYVIQLKIPFVEEYALPIYRSKKKPIFKDLFILNLLWIPLLIILSPLLIGVILISSYIIGFFDICKGMTLSSLIFNAINIILIIYFLIM